jgi:hypothetical protein
MGPKKAVAKLPHEKKPADPLMLQCGAQNNYPAFKEAFSVLAVETYGFLGTICEGNAEDYQVEPITPDQYMPVEADVDGVAPAPLGAAVIARLREQAVVLRNKEVRRINELRPKFYAFIELHVSSDSMVQIAAHTDFEAVYAAKNPHGLWAIIIYTHLTNVNGAIPEMSELTIADRLEEFSNLKQRRNESIGDFLQRLKLMYITLTAVGAPAFSDAQKAVQFLKRLDPERYGAYMADLYNRAARREPLPPNLYAAFTLASNFYVQRSSSRFTPGEHSAFALSGRGGRNGRGRGGRGRGGRSDQSEGKKVFVERRTCYNCRERGHIAENCPKEPLK